MGSDQQHAFGMSPRKWVQIQYFLEFVKVLPLGQAAERRYLAQDPRTQNKALQLLASSPGFGSCQYEVYSMLDMRYTFAQPRNS